MPVEADLTNPAHPRPASIYQLASTTVTADPGVGQDKDLQNTEPTIQDIDLQNTSITLP